MSLTPEQFDALRQYFERLKQKQDAHFRAADQLSTKPRYKIARAPRPQRKTLQDSLDCRSTLKIEQFKEFRARVERVTRNSHVETILDPENPIYSHISPFKPR